MMGVDERLQQTRREPAGALAHGPMTRAGAELDAAYAHCEALTRRRAANFYYGIRLLPAQRRRAMCAVYAFARRVDDIGDGTMPRAQKLEQLERQAQQLPALGAAAHGAGGPPAGGARGDDAPAGG